MVFYELVLRRKKVTQVGKEWNKNLLEYIFFCTLKESQAKPSIDSDENRYIKIIKGPTKDTRIEQ